MFVLCVGQTNESFGWDIASCILAGGIDDGLPYPVRPTEVIHHGMVPDTFVLILDMDECTLSFIVGDQYLGVAHTFPRSLRPLHIVVGAVYGDSRITLRYLGGYKEPVMSLYHQALVSSRKQLHSPSHAKDLPLPALIQKDLTLGHNKQMEGASDFFLSGSVGQFV